MDILLGSLKKLLEKLFFKEANERVLLKRNSFLRKNVKLWQKYGDIQKVPSFGRVELNWKSFCFTRQKRYG